jgi:hypothetical protein
LLASAHTQNSVDKLKQGQVIWSCKHLTMALLSVAAGGGATAALIWQKMK